MTSHEISPTTPLVAEKRRITPEGYARLERELQDLWRQERPKVVNEVSEAAAHGDRSENAEYKYGKMRLREIDRRVRYLSKLLEKLTVVDPKQNKKESIDFGATVTIEDEEGRKRTYQIVGEDEADVKEKKISTASPMGKALLGHRVDDELVVVRPAGELLVTVLDIKYV